MYVDSNFTQVYFTTNGSQSPEWVRVLSASVMYDTISIVHGKKILVFVEKVPSWILLLPLAPLLNTCHCYLQISSQNSGFPGCFCVPNIGGLVQDCGNSRGPGLTWIHIQHKVWDKITYPFPNFNGCAVEVWEWISNLIWHLIMDVITYPCWDQNQSLLVKGAPVHQQFWYLNRRRANTVHNLGADLHYCNSGYRYWWLLVHVMAETVPKQCKNMQAGL